MCPGISFHTSRNIVSDPAIARVASNSGSAASFVRAETSPLSRIALISDAKIRRWPASVQ